MIDQLIILFVVALFSYPSPRKSFGFPLDFESKQSSSEVDRSSDDFEDSSPSRYIEYLKIYIFRYQYII